MSISQKTNRNWIIVASIVIQLALGIIYAWSVFTQSLIEASWSKTQTQIVFSVCLATFAITMVYAGRKLADLGPQKLIKLGALFLGGSYFLAGLLHLTSVASVTLFLGLLAGIGIGLAYVVPIKVGISWFPDKKGLITGLGVAGFGFGATLWVKLAGSWGHLITKYGLHNTWIIYGIIFFIMLMLAQKVMIFPKKNQPRGSLENIDKKIDFSSFRILKQINFYKLFFTFIISAGAGLMTIGLMKLFPQEALIDANPELTDMQASVIAGTAMAVFFSLANGLGRIVWGIIADKIGANQSLILMTSLQGIAIFLFQRFAAYQVTLYLTATIIGFNFGGNFSLFPVMTANNFGQRDLAENYSLVFLAYGIGGILGPILGGYLGDLQNFPLAFTICGLLCILASFIAASIQSEE